METMNGRSQSGDICIIPEKKKLQMIDLNHMVSQRSQPPLKMIIFCLIMLQVGMLLV